MSLRRCRKPGIEGRGSVVWSGSPPARCTRNCPRTPSPEASQEALREWEPAMKYLQSCSWLLPVWDCLQRPAAPGLANVDASDECRECQRSQFPIANLRATRSEHLMNIAE